MDWLDDILKYTDQDYLFGANPESGSWQDIAQSFLNTPYDPEGSLIGRILRAEERVPSTPGVNPEGDPMYGSSGKTNPVIRDLEQEEANRPAWSPSSATYDAPDMITVPQYEVPRRKVGMIGGNPNMYGNLQNDITEEEKLEMLSRLLRGRA
jgi:hypothetical protein